MKYYLNPAGTRYTESIIYKYTNIGQNLFSLLINNELWFSDPYSFNDPYDCNLNYNYDNLQYQMIYDYLTSANEKLPHKADVSYLEKRAAFLFNNPSDLMKSGDKIIKDEVKNKGITCFSEVDSALLMWSHYADSHKGVCLTFDVEEDNKFFNLPYKVDYPDSYPKFNPFDKVNELQLILATKSKEWSYEKEVRIIKDARNEPNRGAIKFDPKALKEVKFGYKASVENIKTVKALIRKLNLNVKIFVSELKQGEFGLRFIEND